MSKKQILTAWSQSSSREQAVHKKFSEKMIGKTLVNSGCNMIINSTPDLAYASNDNEQYSEKESNIEDAVAEEVVESTETVDSETGEVIKQSEDQKQEESDF